MDDTVLTTRLAVFTLAMIPLLREYFTSGVASNRGNMILFVVGVTFAGYEMSMGSREASFGLFLSWAIVIVGALSMVATGMAAGGVGKMLAALAPWFNFPQMMLVIVIGMVSTALIAKLRGGREMVAAPLYVAGCTVWIFNLS